MFKVSIESVTDEATEDEEKRFFAVLSPNDVTDSCVFGEALADAIRSMSVSRTLAIMAYCMIASSDGDDWLGKPGEKILAAAKEYVDVVEKIDRREIESA